MKKLAFRLVDVFTDRPLAGNQLAVVLDAEGVDDGTMQGLAREFNFSETTFVLPATQSGCDVRVRIFTTTADAVVDTVLFLHKPAVPDLDGRPASPAFLAVHDLMAVYPELASGDLAMIDIQPLTAGVRIWAFVTSTHNVTQQFNHFVE